MTDRTYIAATLNNNAIQNHSKVLATKQEAEVWAQNQLSGRHDQNRAVIYESIADVTFAKPPVVINYYSKETDAIPTGKAANANLAGSGVEFDKLDSAVEKLDKEIDDILNKVPMPPTVDL